MAAIENPDGVARRAATKDNVSMRIAMGAARVPFKGE
jgi:hypothetical protein